MSKQSDFEQALQFVERSYSRLEDKTAREVVRLMREFRAELQAMLVSGSRYDQFRVREYLGTLQRLARELETQLGRTITQPFEQVDGLGQASVVNPLTVIGYEGLAVGASLPQVATIADLTLDLLKGMTAEAVKKITSQIRFGALGQRSTLEVMREISKILGFEGREFVGGVTFQAERIARTETQRVYNLAGMKEAQDAAQSIPDLKKYWMATGDNRTRDSHLAAHRRYRNKPIPVDKPFIVGGHAMMHPLDPAGPPSETINCRCRMGLVVPEVDPVASELDREIARGIRRRN